jgi:surface-anchored protein
VTLKLKSVVGPGAFSVFSIDGFGVPNVHMNSGDGIDTNDVKSIVTGSHEHVAWAFGAAGYYRVAFEAEGTLVAGSEFTTSEDVTYYFEVLPIQTQLAITRTESEARISFITQDGLTYQLESAPAITGPWANEGAAFIGTGGTKHIPVPLSPGAQFFRINASTGN